jgi:hypothetical protein
MNQDDELRQYESTTLQNLQNSEVHWHIVKTILFIVCCAATIFTVVYYSNRILLQEKVNRHLTVCALTAFTSTNETQAQSILNQCVRQYQ